MVSKQFSFIDLLDLLDLSDPKGNNSLCTAQGIEPKEPDRIWKNQRTVTNSQMLDPYLVSSQCWIDVDV